MPYSHDIIALTLWEDLARNEGHLLEEQLFCKPKIALLKANITTCVGTHYKLHIIYFLKHLYHIYINH